jgi:hypothetical protein
VPLLLHDRRLHDIDFKLSLLASLKRENPCRRIVIPTYIAGNAGECRTVPKASQQMLGSDPNTRFDSLTAYFARLTSLLALPATSRLRNLLTDQSTEST